MLRITYSPPPHFTTQQADEMRRKEDDHARVLIQQGSLLQIWRVVGTQSNFSLWQAKTLEALHAELSALPMFPFLKIEVSPLIEHPLGTACKKLD